MNSSLNQLTYEYMKKDIMTFSLKPGESVSAAKIAERYKVSRTPAREALVKLELEGLVDIYPKSKSIISKIDVDRAKQEWFLRRTLELGMVDDLFDRIKKSDILKMRASSRKMIELSKEEKTHDVVYEYLRCDNEFHALTYYVAGQRLSAATIASTMTHYGRIRILTDLDQFYQERTVNTHEQLIELLEQNKRDEYRKLLEKHLDYITKDIEDLRKTNPELFKE